jgi:hypothetical protein
VEFFHHRHQLRDLHEQIQEVFTNNLRLEPENHRHMVEFRAYLVELQTAVQARISGKPLGSEPAMDDPRMKIFTATPSLGPYDVAKANGTAALLGSDELRIYNRMDIQRGYLAIVIAEWFSAIRDMEIFEQQFSDSPGSVDLGDIVRTPSLEKLNAGELLEYRRQLAAVIKTTDLLVRRTLLFDAMCRTVLDGARSEAELLKKTGKQLGMSIWNDLERPAAHH